jgi:GDP-L-fucose synthase
MPVVLVTGSSGMLGKLVSDALESRGHVVIRHNRGSADLTDLKCTQSLFSTTKPDVVVHCAALVGGIKANIDGGERFYLENVLIDHNVLTTAAHHEISKLVYIGSSCMYPANIERALRIEDLLTGPLEPTNSHYALAKIAGSHLATSIAASRGFDWTTLITSNLYGPGDHFNSDRSHLLASIIYKASEVLKNGDSQIVMWGDGCPKREFTYAPDLAEWISGQIENLHLFPQIMNVGYGEDFSVIEYYKFVLTSMNLDVQIVSDLTKPSGNMRKLMDSSVALDYGWRANTTLHEGIAKTISWFQNNEIR